MKIIAEHEGCLFGSISIESPKEFSCPFEDVLYPCLIWDHGSNFSDEDMSSLAEALINSGCRYTLSAGENCEDWEDCIDWKYIMLGENIPLAKRDDSDFVMTTCHTDWSPSDIAFHFVYCTDVGNGNKPRHFLVLHVGKSDSEQVINESVCTSALEYFSD